jgi:hypothetical protein
LITALLCPRGSANAQQLYTLSAQVQKFSDKNKIGEKVDLPADSIAYKDILTAVDLIGKARAEVQHRNDDVRDEDFQAAGWMLCFLPWTPPKDAQDKEKMKKLRPEFVDGVFKSEERRKKLVDLLDRDRLALSGDQIKQQHLKPWDFFKLTERRPHVEKLAPEKSSILFGGN